MAVSLYQPPDPLTIEQFLSPCSIIQVTLCPLALRSFTKMENMGSPYEVVDSLGLFDGGHYRIDYSEFRISKPKSVVYGCFLTGSQPGWIRCIAYGSTQEAALNACCAQLIAICSQKPVLATNLLSSYQTSQNGKFQLFSQPCLVAAPDTSVSLTTPLNESELANQDVSVLEQSRISESQEEPQLKKVKVEPGIIDPNYMCSTPIDKNQISNSESSARTKISDDHVKDSMLCSDNHGVEKESTSEFNNDGLTQSMEAHKNGDSKIGRERKTLKNVSIDQFFDMDPKFSPKCTNLNDRGRRFIETSLEKGNFLTPSNAMSYVATQKFTHVHMQFESKDGQIMYLFGLTAYTRNRRTVRTIAFANHPSLARSACYAKMFYLYFDERHLPTELLRIHWVSLNGRGRWVLHALPEEVVVDASLAGKFSQTLCSHGVKTECKIELKTNLCRANVSGDHEENIHVKDTERSSMEEKVTGITTHEKSPESQVISFEEYLDINPAFREEKHLPLSNKGRIYINARISEGYSTIGPKGKWLFPSLIKENFRLCTINKSSVFAVLSSASNSLTMAFSNNSKTAACASIAKLMYVIYGERQLAVSFFQNHWREPLKRSSFLYDKPNLNMLTCRSRTVLHRFQKMFGFTIGCISKRSSVNSTRDNDDERFGQGNHDCKPNPFCALNDSFQSVSSNQTKNNEFDNLTASQTGAVEKTHVDDPGIITVDDSEDEHSKLVGLFSTQKPEIKSSNSMDVTKSGKRKLVSYSNADLLPCSKRLKNLMTGNETLKYELELIKENVKQTKLSLNNDGQRKAGNKTKIIEKRLKGLQESICCNNLELSVENNLVSKEFVVTLTVNGTFKFSDKFESFDNFSPQFCKTLKRTKRFVKLLEEATDAPLIPKEMSENVPFLANILQKSAGVDVDLLPVTYKYNSKHGKWRAFLETKDQILKSELKLTKQDSAKRLLLPYMTDILGFQVV